MGRQETLTTKQLLFFPAWYFDTTAQFTREIYQDLTYIEDSKFKNEIRIRKKKFLIPGKFDDYSQARSGVKACCPTKPIKCRLHTCDKSRKQKHFGTTIFFF